jgi:hypothetical protein
VFSEWLQAVLEHKTQLLLVRLVEAGIGQRFWRLSLSRMHDGV